MMIPNSTLPYIIVHLSATGSYHQLVTMKTWMIIVLTLGLLLSSTNSMKLSTSSNHKQIVKRRIPLFGDYFQNYLQDITKLVQQIQEETTRAEESNMKVCNTMMGHWKMVIPCAVENSQVPRYNREVVLRRIY